MDKRGARCPQTDKQTESQEGAPGSERGLVPGNDGGRSRARLRRGDLVPGPQRSESREGALGRLGQDGGAVPARGLSARRTPTSQWSEGRALPGQGGSRAPCGRPFPPPLCADGPLFLGAQRNPQRGPPGARPAAGGLPRVTTGVPALEVYTPKEIFVANGTQGKLTCKFKSANTTGTSTSVSWSFQPEGTDTTVSFFHYSQGQVYPGNYPPFKDRTSWAGDLDKKDASINIENMQFIHNGTYICDVKNPPDIVAQPGHIRLYVVEKEVLPVFPVWVVVGIVTAVVLGLTLLISMTLAVLYRRRNSKRDYIGAQSYMRS
ncbi:myelin protein zero-like protein 1 isoform X2 [Lutra lutra]|uniref:myelin protein zero-like protein 1 isoform X2 n=1 Tax=Lutra lutra TaxID=9657 RepID=UPI001FD3478B|nr:myelin protein zero-like protein 1 isoform X2 [Lutra lutra]